MTNTAVTPNTHLCDSQICCKMEGHSPTTGGTPIQFVRHYHLPACWITGPSCWAYPDPSRLTLV